tara:strand:+ start:592 stop:1347 length:756 start_codon:yes stop_codon:yes gene_type:complete
MVPTPMNINNNNKNEAVSMNINELLPRKQINSTRSTPIKETNLIIKVKLPEKTVQQLRRVMLITNRKGYEYMGTIDMSRSVNRDIVFNPPTRQTSGNRGTIIGNYSAIDDAYLSYHSHPGFEGYFTLPSKQDLIRYMEYYPRMQANIILDRHGYYVIDFIETRKNDRPNKKFVLDEYEKTVGKSAFKKIEHVMSNAVYYKTHLGKWKKIIEKEFSNTKGISIKYYGYNQRANITLVNKDLFPKYNNTRPRR